MSDLDVRKIREQLQISQTKLSEVIGVSLRTIQNWESGETIPKTKHEILRNLLLKDKIQELEFVSSIKTLKKGIPLLPFDAFAGVGDSSVSGVDFNAITERYEIPLFDGLQIDFMLPVRGSSMYPKYSSGDVVACRLISELLFVQWNKVYIIDSISQGIMMKRLKKGTKEDYMICKSDNAEYGEFEIPKTDIRNIALVVGVVRLE